MVGHPDEEDLPLTDHDAPRAVLAQLATFVADLSYDDIPAGVVEQAKLTLQHNLLVALAARHEHLPGQDRADWPAGLPAASSATRLTDGRPAPAEQAVVTNALAMGARAQHDEHPGAISHFGSTVIPPLLAVAEQDGVAGARVLTAMVAGYEVGARIGAASVQATSRRGLRPTGLYGPLAGATAAGKAVGASADVLTSALAFAANTSSGVTQTWLRGTDEWRYQTAFASRNAYTSARLAVAGARGAADTLEGANGFNRAFAAVEIDPAAILEGLGERWALDDILLKPYPACAFNQAPIQQLLGLRATHHLDPAGVARVVAHLTPEDLAYPGVDNVEPLHTRAAAVMCLRTCLALALLHDDVTIEDLDHPDTAEVLALSRRIDLVADATIETHTSFVEVTDARGTTVSSGGAAGTVYDQAVSRALVARLQPLTGMDDQQVADLVGALQSLHEAPDLSGILDLVRASAPRPRCAEPIPPARAHRPRHPMSSVGRRGRRGMARSTSSSRATEPSSAEAIAGDATTPTTAMPWAEAQRRLADAQQYWFATTRHDGRPHVRPVLGVWVDGHLHTTSGPAARKARNLAAHDGLLLLHQRGGRRRRARGQGASRVTDPARLQRVADAYQAKYGWPPVVVDGAFDAPYGAPTAGPPPYAVFEVRPDRGVRPRHRRRARPPLHPLAILTPAPRCYRPPRGTAARLAGWCRRELMEGRPPCVRLLRWSGRHSCWRWWARSPSLPAGAMTIPRRGVAAKDRAPPWPAPVAPPRPRVRPRRPRPKPPGWAGELKVAGTEGKTMDPAKISSESGDQFDRPAAVFDTLLRMKKDNTGTGQLAESMDVDRRHHVGHQAAPQHHLHRRHAARRRRGDLQLRSPA